MRPAVREARDDDGPRSCARPAIGSWPWPIVQPATTHVEGIGTARWNHLLAEPSQAAVVVALEDEQAHAAAGQPSRSRRTSSLVRRQGRGDSTRSPATTSRAIAARSSTAASRASVSSSEWAITQSPAAPRAHS